MIANRNAFPAEMLPPEIWIGDVLFHLAAAKTGVPNALIAKGQTIDLPAGLYQRVYVPAASAGGDRKATFVVGGHSTESTVEYWSGFIGQWDNRKWVAKDTPIPARASSQCGGGKRALRLFVLVCLCDRSTGRC